MKIIEITEARIDNQNGAGAVPYNQDVDYFGLAVHMKPSMFLKLALRLPRDEALSVDGLKTHLSGGGAIGSPWFTVAIPESWDDGNFDTPAKIQNHEGRNRMYAVSELEGDEPIEVHLFFSSGYRSRDITDEFIIQLQKHMIAEKSSTVIQGPIFSIRR